MEGEEVASAELATLLPDLLAAYLAGDCDLRVEVRFCVGAPGAFKESCPAPYACPAVGDCGEEAIEGASDDVLRVAE